MKLSVSPYLEQTLRWPIAGRHILANYDDETIIVYQAYRPSIGRYAVENGQFGGDFSYSRMSWVKPNFLWMMYRSGWGTKADQEITLGLRIRREFFDSLLERAVASTWDRNQFASSDEWADALQRSDVRLQWDPDHHPSGAKLERRAIQLGIRGATLEEFGKRQILEVIDFTEFVEEQRASLQAQGVHSLVTPNEQIYLPAPQSLITRIRLDSNSEGN